MDNKGNMNQGKYTAITLICTATGIEGGVLKGLAKLEI